MEYANAVKNCGIEERKVLEYTREPTGREAAVSVTEPTNFMRLSKKIFHQSR